MIKYIQRKLSLFLKKRKVRRDLKKIDQELLSLSWYIGVEKSDDDNLLAAYNNAQSKRLIKQKELDILLSY